MATLNQLPAATTPGQVYTLTDGRQLITVYDRPSTDPDARLIWNEVVQQIGVDETDFEDGANTVEGRVLIIGAGGQYRTIAQSTQTGSGISEADALGLIDAAVAATDDGLVSTGTGLIGLADPNRLGRADVLMSELTTMTPTNPTTSNDYLIYDVSPLFGAVRRSNFVTRELTATGENFIMGTDASAASYLTILY